LDVSGVMRNDVGALGSHDSRPNVLPGQATNRGQQLGLRWSRKYETANKVIPWTLHITCQQGDAVLKKCRNCVWDPLFQYREIAQKITDRRIVIRSFEPDPGFPESSLRGWLRHRVVGQNWFPGARAQPIMRSCDRRFSSR
jgi:hypothetical protein